MARASSVSLSLRRAGFPVVSESEKEALDAVDRLYNAHVRVGQAGVYTTGSTQCMVWVIGGPGSDGKRAAAELLAEIREHLERKYPPTPVLGARDGQTRPRVTQYPSRFSGRDVLYVD